MDEQRLAVATYNIHGWIGTDGQYRPGRIAEVIRELAADVIGLQEVDGRARPGRAPFQLEQLAEAAGFRSVAGPIVRSPGGDYGNGLLSSYPILAVRHVDLTVRQYEPRGAIDADLDVAGEVVRVVVTHLGLRPGERRAQIARLLEVIGTCDGRRVVVLGDFNEWYPRSRCLRLLNGHLGSAAAPRTFPSRRPIFALDRIWCVPDGAIASLDVHASPIARRASDHLPVRALLVWPRGGAAG